MTSPVVHVVDDDARILRAITRFLRSYDFRVRTYSSAAEFLRQQIPPGPACLVLDLKMPGINGLQLQQVLARRGLDIPTVFVNEKADIETSVRAMKGGAVDFLTKPFAYGQLLAAVQVALARSRTSISAHDDALNRDREAFEKLTPRERQVCIRIARDLLNKQAGFELGTTEKTTLRILRIRDSSEKVKVGERLRELVRLSNRMRANSDGSIEIALSRAELAVLAGITQWQSFWRLPGLLLLRWFLLLLWKLGIRMRRK